MPARESAALAAFVELFDREGAGRFEQPETRFGATDIRDDQRFRHQIGQAVDRLAACRCRVYHHRCGRLDRKAARKYTESPEEKLLILAQQAVAPIDDGPHRSVPLDPPATARTQERQAVLQAGDKALKSKHLDARCGELDRQRQAIEPTAKFEHQLSILVGQREIFDDRGHPLDEQLHGRKGRRLGGRQPGRGRWASEGPQAVFVFTRDPERLPARSQNIDILRSADKRRRQPRHLVDDMLAVVEEKEHSVVSDGSDQAVNRIFGGDLKAEHGRNRARHKARVTERCQVDQPDSMLVFCDHSLGDGEGGRRLADTSGPDDCHQALARQPRDERLTASSRPIIRVTVSGRLCTAADGAVWGGRVRDGSSTRTGATKL